jgi:hypothetical protein
MSTCHWSSGDIDWWVFFYPTSFRLLQETLGSACPSGDKVGHKGPSPAATIGTTANPELVSTTAPAGETTFTREGANSGCDSNANRLFEFLKISIVPYPSPGNGV